MLNKIIYSLYSLNNLSALARKMRNLLAEKFPSEAIVISLLAKIDQAQTVAVQAIGSSTKQTLTALVRSTDRSRDNSYASLRDHVWAGLRRENEAYRLACEALWPLFEKNNTQLGFLANDKETQAIESLLSDLRTGHGPAHLATINASAWIEELDRDNKAFVAAQQQRASVKTEDTTVTDAKAFKQLSTSLELVNSAMDGLTMMAVEGVAEVAAELNTYIGEANTNARKKKNHSSEENPAN